MSFGPALHVLRPQRQTLSTVIVRAEVYERRRASCGDFGTRDAYPAMDQVAVRERWNDTSMDIYFEPRHNELN